MAIWFLIMGVICLHRTRQLQQWFNNVHQSVPAAQAWTFFFDWTQTNSFLLVTRILGALSLVNFIMLFYVSLSGHSEQL